MVNNDPYLKKLFQQIEEFKKFEEIRTQTKKILHEESLGIINLDRERKWRKRRKQ